MNQKWNNTHIYNSIESTEISKDFEKVENFIQLLENENSNIINVLENLETEQIKHDSVIEFLQKNKKSLEEALFTVRDIITFANSILSVNSINEKAKMISLKASKMYSDLSDAMNPGVLYLTRCSDELLKKYLDHEDTRASEEYLKSKRKYRPHLLSPNEEKIINKLEIDGHHSWGELYTEISGTLKVEIEKKDQEKESISLAMAKNYLNHSDEKIRKAAYNGIDKAWKSKKDIIARGINSITGWRLEEYSMRSLHYLDEACFSNRLERKTLETLVETTRKNKDLVYSIFDLQKKVLKVDKLNPWDMTAPFPSKGEVKQYTFNESMNIIFEAFAGFDPKLSDFAKLMVEKGWIDCEPSENRRQGAYCTKFLAKKEPRVFSTFTGTINNIITLAHEIGHAYHSWVLKEKSFDETTYTMSLAETASTFAETLVRDHILNHSSEDDQKSILWMELKYATVFLLNILTRFDFEVELFEKRKSGYLTASNLCELSQKCFHKNYGDHVSIHSDMIWSNVLHYHLTYISFYNFPYLFGYLFSKGIYLRKDDQGFKDLYQSILIDTGKFSCEEVAKRNLGVDLKESVFWQDSIDSLKPIIYQFSELIKLSKN